MIPCINISLPELLQTVGYIGVFIIIFAESGLFFGFFLPGDSVLFTAGLLASQGFFNLWLLIGVIAVAAILGDNVGYWFGKHAGGYLYAKEDSRIFKRKHLERGKNFYEENGHKAIMLARFIPIVRTFAPIVAGTAEMSYDRFVFWNIIGGFSWTVILVLLGNLLGDKIPNVDHYLLPIVLVIIVISLIPLFWTITKKRLQKILTRKR